MANRRSCVLVFRPRPARMTWDRLKWNSIFRSFSCVCCTFGRRRDLVQRCRLYFAHSEKTTAGGSVEVCLQGLVGYDEPRCKALPCLTLVYLQCSKSVVLAVRSNSATHIFFFLTPCFFFFIISTALYLNPSFKRYHPWLLSVPQTHTCTQCEVYTNMMPLMAHLTPETLEPGEGQMVDAGRGLVCELVPVPRRFRTGNIDRECGVSRRHCTLLHFLFPDAEFRFVPFRSVSQSAQLCYVLFKCVIVFWQPQRRYQRSWFLAGGSTSANTRNALGRGVKAVTPCVSW